MSVELPILTLHTLLAIDPTYIKSLTSKLSKCAPAWMNNIPPDLAHVLGNASNNYPEVFHGCHLQLNLSTIQDSSIPRYVVGVSLFQHNSARCPNPKTMVIDVGSCLPYLDAMNLRQTLWLL